MAKLPTQESLGGLPSIPARPIATFDTTAIGKGVEGLGQGIAQIGAAAEAIKATKDRADEFETERRFQDFNWQHQQDLDAQMRQVEPGKADGFADQWAGGYKESAKGFLDTVPDALKPKYALRLDNSERKFYGDAAVFARTEQKRYSLEQLNDRSNSYYSRASSGEPLDAIQNDYKTVLDKNPYLTPIEKDAVIREGFGSLEDAQVRGRLARGEDPAAILKDLKGEPAKPPLDTSENPETRAKPFEGTAAGPDPNIARAAISTQLETGKTDPLAGVANISRDSGGTKSYGNFGLNSGGSAQKFVSEYGGALGLSGEPGTAEFDKSWKAAAAADPQGLHAAEMDWYAKHISSGIETKLVKAGIPAEVASDPRVQAYFADRSVQQGEESIAKHARRIRAAADAAKGDPTLFLQRMNQADSAALQQDFPTALRTGVYSAEGHANRLNGRLQMALGVTDKAAEPAPQYDLGPYKHLDSKTRSTLINVVTLAGRETALADMRDAEAELRRVGKASFDAQGRTALDRAKEILTPNQFTKARLGWDEALSEHKAVAPLADMTAGEAADHLDGLTPKLGVGDDRYAIADRVQKKAEAEWKRIAGLRDSDPALSVDRSPEVTQAKDKLRHLANMPEDRQNAILIEARKAAQDRVGIPAYQQRIVTDAEAADLLQLPRNPESPETVETAMQDAAVRAKQRYGRYAGEALDSAISVHLKGKENKDTARIFADALKAENAPKPVQPDNSWTSYFTGWFGSGQPKPGAAPAAGTQPGAGSAPTKNNPLPAPQSSGPSQAAPNQAQINWALADPQNRQAAFDDKFGPGAFARAMAARQTGGAR
jgi:hypothetical protein